MTRTDDSHSSAFIIKQKALLTVGKQGFQNAFLLLLPAYLASVCVLTINTNAFRHTMGDDRTHAPRVRQRGGRHQAPTLGSGGGRHRHIGNSIVITWFFRTNFVLPDTRVIREIVGSRQLISLGQLILQF
jgi:hypothetical protein